MLVGIHFVEPEQVGGADHVRLSLPGRHLVNSVAGAASRNVGAGERPDERGWMPGVVQHECGSGRPTHVHDL
jgi:hypothetical protein